MALSLPWPWLAAVTPRTLPDTGALLLAALPPVGGLVIAIDPDAATVQALAGARALPQDLLIVESDWQRAAARAMQYPLVEVLHGAPAQLARLVDMPPYTVRAVAAALPRSSAAAQYRLLRQAFDLLNQGGCSLHWGTGARCPVDSAVLARLGLAARRQAILWHQGRPQSLWAVTRRANP